MHDDNNQMMEFALTKHGILPKSRVLISPRGLATFHRLATRL